MANDDKGKSVLSVVLQNIELAAQTNIEVEISEFNNPIESDHSLIIEAFDNIGYLVERSNEPMLLQASQPAIISTNQASLQIDSGSRQINQNSGLRLTFESPIPLPLGCQINIKVYSQSAQMATSGTSSFLSNTLQYIYAYGMFGSTLRSLPFQNA